MAHPRCNIVPVRCVLLFQGYASVPMLTHQRRGLYAEKFPSVNGHNWCPDAYQDCHEYKRELLKVTRFNERKKKAIRDGQTPRIHIPFEVRKRVSKKSKFGCVYCGRHCNQKTSKGPLRAAVDHIVPLALGGSNEEHNLALACRECNAAKGDKIWSMGCRIGYYSQ